MVSARYQGMRMDRDPLRGERVGTSTPVSLSNDPVVERVRRESLSQRSYPRVLKGRVAVCSTVRSIAPIFVLSPLRALVVLGLEGESLAGIPCPLIAKSPAISMEVFLDMDHLFYLS